ncbi:MAG TPA: oligosaccharide flippase family protein [Sphingobacteriaceae bacterium]|nr:oligosaccharide flippase family protein [Sphingobacteriaceae bacterium]
MSTLKKFAGQTLIYGLSTVIARLFNFVLTPLFVKKYPAGVYGIFTTVYAWAAILNAIIAFGMETTFFRYLQKNKDNKEKVYNNTFFVILFMVLIFICTTVLFTREIASWVLSGENLSDATKYIQFFVFILSADAIAVIPFAKIRADERPLRYGMIKLINILIFVCFSIFFIVIIPILLKNNSIGSEWIATWYQPGWIGYVFIANLIASIATLLLLLPEILQIRFQIEKALILDMFWYSFPILIANISFIINENLDKIFLSKLLPEEVSKVALGTYGAVQKLAIFLSIFVQAFRLGAEPFFFSHAKNPNSGKTYALIMDYFIIGMSLVMVGLVANIEILKHFIKGGDVVEQAQYWSGLPVVPVLLMGYIFLGIYMNLSIWYKLSDQTRFGLYISVVGAIITIVFNLIFIPKYSFYASAWITMFVYFSMMVLSFLLGQKNHPIPYHVLKNVLYILAAAGLSWLSFSVFKQNLIIGNILFSLFLLVTTWIEWKQLSVFIIRKK